MYIHTYIHLYTRRYTSSRPIEGFGNFSCYFLCVWSCVSGVNQEMVAGCLGTGRSGAYFDLKEELIGVVRELHSAVHHNSWFDRRREYFDGLRNRKARLLVVLQHKTDLKENGVRFLLTCQTPMRKKVSGRFHSSLQCFRVCRCLLADHWHLLRKSVCNRRVCPYVLLFSSNLYRSNLTPWSYNVTVFKKISDQPYTAIILYVPNVDKHDTIRVIFCRNIRAKRRVVVANTVWF